MHEIFVPFKHRDDHNSFGQLRSFTLIVIIFPMIDTMLKNFECTPLVLADGKTFVFQRVCRLKIDFVGHFLHSLFVSHYIHY